MKIIIEDEVQSDYANPCYVRCPNCAQTYNLWKSSINLRNENLNYRCDNCKQIFNLFCSSDGFISVKE